jgi:DNA modification methylase
MKFDLHHGDCLEVLRTMADNSVDSIVTDPPYGLSFMGKKWDYDVPGVEVWTECLRVLKPGGHLLAFAGTRTQHRMAVRIEDAGFEIRDMIAWVYGSGFPKSLDVSKAIDKRGGASVAWFGPWFRKWREDNGVAQKQVAALFPSKTGGLTGCVANWELGLNMPTPEQFNLIRDTFGFPFASVEEAEREVVGHGHRVRRESVVQVAGCSDGEFNITAPATEAAKQWQGWGTALKPALEPVTVARKPLIGTVAENVLEHGTGGLNIDGCRVDGGDKPVPFGNPSQAEGWRLNKRETDWQPSDIGRWPANLIHDGSDEVVAAFPQAKGQQGSVTGEEPSSKTNAVYGQFNGRPATTPRGDTGSAARFFYAAKASKRDRDEGLEGFEAKATAFGNQAQAELKRGNLDHDDGKSGMNKVKMRQNSHPTVKPTDLMRYLCRLVTPPGGVVLDPFMGSGSTGKAAMLEGFRFVGIEREAEYLAIARARIEAATMPEPKAEKPAAQTPKPATHGQNDLFSEAS